MSCYRKDFSGNYQSKGRVNKTYNILSNVSSYLPASVNAQEYSRER